MIVKISEDKTLSLAGDFLLSAAETRTARAPYAAIEVTVRAAFGTVALTRFYKPASAQRFMEKLLSAYRAHVAEFDVRKAAEPLRDDDRAFSPEELETAQSRLSRMASFALARRSPA